MAMLGTEASLALRVRRARVNGGCGCTIPSCHIKPSFSGVEGEIEQEVFQEIGGRAGSESQGCAERIVCMKSFRPDRLVLRGPMTVAMGSAPGGMLDQPVVGMRKAVGLRP